MSQNILVDEIGYLPSEPKRAIYRGEGTPEFSVINKATGEVQLFAMLPGKKTVF